MSSNILPLMRTAQAFVTRCGDAGFPVDSVTIGFGEIAVHLDYQDRTVYGQSLTDTLGIDIDGTRDHAAFTATRITFHHVPVTIYGTLRVPVEASL